MKGGVGRWAKERNWEKTKGKANGVDPWNPASEQTAKNNIEKNKVECPRFKK